MVVPLQFLDLVAIVNESIIVFSLQAVNVHLQALQLILVFSLDLPLCFVNARLLILFDANGFVLNVGLQLVEGFSVLSELRSQPRILAFQLRNFVASMVKITRRSLLGMFVTL
jgi:hypothetical protein